MIEFKITQSPEKLHLGVYQHFDAEISFGSSEGDLLLDDPLVAERHARVFFEGTQAKVKNLSQDSDIKVNVTTVKPGDSALIKAKDNLTIGKTVIQFTSLSPLPPSPPAPYMHPQHESRFAEGTKEHTLYKVLGILEADAKPATQVKPPMPPTPPPPPKGK